MSIVENKKAEAEAYNKSSKTDNQIDLANPNTSNLPPNAVKLPSYVTKASKK